MSSNDAESLLSEIAHLMDLNGENAFKVRAFKKAAEVIANCAHWRELARQGRLEELPGIGKGVSAVLTEYFHTAGSVVRDELLAQVPQGLLELSSVPGVGPKKARQLIDELGIRSIGELEYACRENRLVALKGFGEKIQARILQGAIFLGSVQGHLRLSEALPVSEKILQALKQKLPGRQILETGALRRRLEVLTQLDFLVEASASAWAKEKTLCDEAVFRVLEQMQVKAAVQFHFSPSEKWGYELARTTATPEHWAKLGKVPELQIASEEEFYKKVKTPWLSPELRESGEEVEMARAGALDDLLPWDGVKGIFHNHTNFSDGSASLEEMVVAALNLKYEYIGISDHSQTSVYAHGLSKEALLEQYKEVERVRKKYPKIRVFWGIESDILADGSLDYDEKQLAKFDFVIASVHSRFGMDRQAMTERMLKAIENPYTKFIGHITGRLLLARPAYEIDMDRIIQAAAKNGVAIELNSNPQRLDLDWRFGKLMRKAGALTSINPDAHSIEGLEDTRYGVMMARKGLFSTKQVLNSRSALEVEKWLKRR